MIIQHYDAAYSAPAYRIAQANWLQRQLGNDGRRTRIVPGAGGLHFTCSTDGISRWHIQDDDPAATAVGAYLGAPTDR